MGRKRKHVGEREPNGRAIRAVGMKEPAPAQMRRLRDAALAGVADARWGSELGRLLLTGKLKPTGQSSAEALVVAGERWAALVGRYHLANAAPSPYLRSASLEVGRGGAAPDPDSEAGTLIAKRERKDIARFDDAHKALMSAGKLAEVAVRSVCERNEPTAFFNIEHLHNGLAALAVFFGLTERAHSVR